MPETAGLDSSLQTFETSDPQDKRALLIGVVLPGQPGYIVEEHLDELAELARSAGMEVLGRALQKRKAPDARTFIGRGKVEEVGTAAGELGANLVIFDDDLSPKQVKNLRTVSKASPSSTAAP